MKLQAYAAVARAPFLVLPVTLVALGTAIAAREDSLMPLRAVAALVGLVALHITVNAFNEASDFRSGIDLQTKRTPFSGGSGTLPAGVLPYRAALHVGIAGTLVGLAAGTWFLALVGWKLVPIVVLGALAVLAYTDLLARAYVGEIFAGLGLGALPVLGTALVQTETVSATAVAASIPAFLMTFNLLLLNEFPDEEADQRGGRRNLVLLLGRPAAARVYALAGLLTPAAIIAAWLAGYFPVSALLGVLPALLLAKPLRWVMKSPREAVPHAALGANVVWILLTNLFLAGGLLL